MEQYNITMSGLAEQELDDIIKYINKLSPQAVIAQYDRLIEKIASLKQMPKRCRLLSNDRLRIKGYRALIVDNYMVFYVVKDKTVQIRRILFGKRNYEWLL